MKAADHRLASAATAHADATLALVDVLRAARACEWEAPTASPVTTVTGIIDPTGEAATAMSGLRLRARVEDALSRLELASDEFLRAASNLEELLQLHSDPHARHAARHNADALTA
ncbi:hypothetical protein [Microbacterium sp.]|uniref:DUF7169 domain-containing protein n=1 Tax=Microbacterium sp. TaxID=51671 RepID=UPI0028126FB9|nr:hypothetical protein [Microbacterium sp.]